MQPYFILALFLSIISVIAAEISCGPSTWLHDSTLHPIQRHRGRQSAAPTKRIIGGTEPKPKAWPWMAYLIYSTYAEKEMRCGATIISERWLITAAHCVTGFWKGTVVVGTKNLHKWHTHEQYFIESVTAHPGFDPYDDTVNNHDIALIKLTRSIAFNEYVQPICLSADDDSLFSKPYHYGYVTGWGYHSKPSPDDSDSKHNSTAPKKHYVVEGLSKQLLEAKIPFIDYDKCRWHWRDWGVGDGHICAGDDQKGTTLGDSGGPLQVRGTDGRWYLVGITSFGDERTKKMVLNQAENPGVYTRVSQYCKFIAEKTQRTVVCSTGSSVCKISVLFVSLLVLLSRCILTIDSF